MQAAAVAAGVVATGEDIMEHDPQLAHRRFFTTIAHPEVGEYRAPTSACIFSESDCTPRRAPLLGEHNEHALKDFLGLTDEDIAGYVIEGSLE
jgi:benzylsuccinate CoA-transferase BbsF subunit